MCVSEPGRFEKWMTVVISALGAVGIAVAAVTAWFSADIIGVVFGERFSQAAGPLVWLGGASAFMFVRHGLAQGLILAGRYRSVVWIPMSALPLNVALNVVLAPAMGSVGMAVAKALTDMAVVVAAGAVWFGKSGKNAIG